MTDVAVTPDGSDKLSDRRRADLPRPYTDVPREDLTEAQRYAVQEVLAQRYHGRKDRDAWDRRYWRGRRGQIYVRPRVLGVARRAVRP